MKKLYFCINVSIVETDERNAKHRIQAAAVPHI